MGRTPRSISARVRILGAVLLVASVGLILVGGITFWVQRERVIANVDIQLNGFAAAVADVADEAGARRAVEGVVSGRADGGAIALVGGDVVAATEASPGLDLTGDAAFLRGIVDAPPGIGSLGGDTATYRFIVIPAGEATIVSAVSFGSRMELVTLGIATYAITAAVVLCAIAVVGWFVIGRLLSPIRQLRETADSITLADLGARIPTDGTDEISDLGRTMNSMLDRLEGSVDVQRQLLDDVRHELKTPITIVRGHLEVMDAADPTDVANTREIGIAELDRMTRLVDDIDLLATV